MSGPDPVRDCAKHGKLKRNCPDCAHDAELAEMTRSNAFWEEEARRELINKEYYRGLVIKIGEMLGVEAKTQDDGNIVPEVLCAKVPEVVANVLTKYRTALEEIADGEGNPDVIARKALR